MLSTLHERGFIRLFSWSVIVGSAGLALLVVQRCHGADAWARSTLIVALTPVK